MTIYTIQPAIKRNAYTYGYNSGYAAGYKAAVKGVNKHAKAIAAVIDDGEGESVFHDHAPGHGDIFSCPACIANSER